MTRTSLQQLRATVTAALGSVTDPELDQSLLELGFARANVDDAGRVTVEVRLPTFWCAPNFAFLMVQDARDAVAAVPGVESVSVRLVDHFAEQGITDSVAAGRSFDEAFPGLSDGQGLDGLRRLFWVKAFTMRQEVLLRRLLAEGRSPAQVTGMRLRDLEPGRPDCQAYLKKREQLGLSVDPAAPLAVLPNGQPVAADELTPYLSRARMTRISVETNSTLCRGLHATRYAEKQNVMREGSPP
jgi:metal-sulfur cluster biosynthetic enzyme